MNKGGGLPNESDKLVRTSNLTTLSAIVEDIIANMSEADKANIVNTDKDDLIGFHHGWGTYIRNHYNLWTNQELLNAIGKEHPDDASGVIIETVWETLQTTGETYRKGKIETEILQYDENKKCLEISTNGGRSIVIDGINYKVAEELADALRMQLITSATLYVADDVAPRTILKRRVTLKVWEYPAHPDNNPNDPS